MSGVEVAGLVLGALPLVISGLEHYADGVRTIRRVRNSSAEFLKLKQTLEVQNQIFLNCLEQLLKNDVDETKLGAMLLDVNDAGWSEKEVDRCLRHRLGRSYSVYLSLVKSMDSTMNEFRDALQLDANGKGPFFVEKKSVSDVLKRLRFGLKMRAYVEFMDEIVSQNQALCQLLNQSRDLEPIRDARRKVPNFEQARTHALSIFQALQKALVSSCKILHRASFYMRPLEVLPKHCLGTSSGRYRVVIHHESKITTSSTLPWSVEETEIRLVDTTEANSAHRGVRFHTIPSTVPVLQQPIDLKEIRDLCGELKQLRSISTRCADSCLGYLEDGMAQCRHSLYWPEKPLVNEGWSKSITLAEVLDKGYRLGESDKRLLALALASGMLRLHNTPWLEKQWGRKDVLLYTRPSGMIVASHPFVNTALVGKATQVRSVSTYFTPCRPIKEETLFALGVLLIEVIMEKPFEKLAAPEDLGPDGTKHELSDFYTADRLVDEIYLRAGERYGDVVRRCIRCEFDQKKSSLDDPMFRRKVYEGVVAVLELEVADLMNL